MYYLFLQMCCNIQSALLTKKDLVRFLDLHDTHLSRQVLRCRNCMTRACTRACHSLDLMDVLTASSRDFWYALLSVQVAEIDAVHSVYVKLEIIHQQYSRKKKVGRMSCIHSA